MDALINLLCRDPARSALFCDFDGVLADIADHFDGARLRPGVHAPLRSLNQSMGRLAVVSGRPVEYLREELPDGIDLVGLYGLEARLDGRSEVVPEAEVWRDAIAAAAAEATVEFGDHAVEPKGLSLTVHYRQEPERAADVIAWAGAAADRSGLRARPAKMSVELHPPVDRTKGSAVIALGTGYEVAAYVGDDIGDLPAFDGLDVLAADGLDVVRVGVRSADMPEQLAERADLILDGTSEVEAMLAALAAATA